MTLPMSLLSPELGLEEEAGFPTQTGLPFNAVIVVHVRQWSITNKVKVKWESIVDVDI